MIPGGIATKSRCLEDLYQELYALECRGIILAQSASLVFHQIQQQLVRERNPTRPIAIVELHQLSDRTSRQRILVTKVATRFLEYTFPKIFRRRIITANDIYRRQFAHCFQGVAMLLTLNAPSHSHGKL